MVIVDVFEALPDTLGQNSLLSNKWIWIKISWFLAQKFKLEIWHIFVKIEIFWQKLDFCPCVA